MLKLLNLFLLAFIVIRLSAQSDAPCGVVDDIMYPIESVETRTIANGSDDFGAFRGRWGGNHVGLDVAFRQQGDPIMAVARGLVTYSDIEGWDTERGVVIIAHTFPNGEVYYSLYGHVEVTDDISLPERGDCVEMGDVIAAVGWPESSAPHLHYEIRRFLPDDGGPGYVTGNPLESGWYHPLDFTALWKTRLKPGFVDYTTFLLVPTLPPVYLDNGMIATASGEIITVTSPPDVDLWRINLDAILSGIAPLPGGRVAARTRSGQTAILNNGRFEALWQVDGPDEPFVVVGDTLIFITVNGGLAAYSPAGEVRWQVAPPARSDGRISELQSGTDSVALGVRLDPGAYAWRVIDSNGAIVFEDTTSDYPIAASDSHGGWYAILNGTLTHITNGQAIALAQIEPLPDRTSRLVADVVGNVYYFAGDAVNTLVSYDAAGLLRWRGQLESDDIQILPPLLGTDAGCLLYGLDLDGGLTIYNAMDGKLVEKVTLYAGGNTSGRPNARMLTAKRDGIVQVNPGFLTTMTLNTHLIAEEAVAGCLLG